MGVVTMTAPIVPQSTIMAAVTCATSLTRPPSRVRPPRMPPTASTRPPMVTRSGFPPDFFRAGSFSAIGFVQAVPGGDQAFVILVPERALASSCDDGPAELDDPFEHFFGGFEDDELLASG